jgi:uncharacterized membrane protein required for colicin V production
MSIFEICLLIILIYTTLNGLFKGLIGLVGRVFGLLVGAFVASHYYLAFFTWSANIYKDHESLGKIISFIVLFVVVTKVTEWAFKLLEKVFNFVAVIPGSKYLNNLAGAILGFLIGAIFLGLIIYVASRYVVVGNLLGLGDQLKNSVIAPVLLRIVKLILPLLPEALKALKSII